jgi:SAM-dependent methyltransferase
VEYANPLSANGDCRNEMIKPRLFFHPHFILKYYVYRDIKQILLTHKFSGSVIDIGCGNKPYKDLFTHVFSYKGIDFKTYSKNEEYHLEKPDYFFSSTYNNNFILPFKAQEFTNSVAFQVFEHHPNPHLFIKELTRITKKNGYILLSFPFIGGLHEVPKDFFRYTEFAIIQLAKENNCKVLEIKKQGSIFSVIIISCIDFLIDFSHRGFFYKTISFFLFPFFLFLSYFSLVLDTVFNSNTIFLNYVVLLKKN